MRVSHLSKIGLAVFMLGALPACGDGEEENTDTEPQGVLEVFSWWVTGGEEAAFNALVDEYNAQYPKVQVVNAAKGSAVDAREVFQQRMAEGDPPDTFQSTAAAGIFQWVGDGDATSSKLLPLNRLADSEGWNDAFASNVRELVTFADTMWAVPVNVHRINSVMYSVPLLEEYGTADPASMDMDALLATCEAMDAAGQVCFGLGVKGSWTSSLWIIDGVFPAVAGPEASRAFLRGETDGDDPNLVLTLEAVAALIPYMNDDRGDLEWDAGAELVIHGDAAFNPMGDWAYAHLKGQATPETDFNVMGHPGAQNVYVMNFDTFPIAAGAPNQRAAEAWLKVVGSEAGQVAFNTLKGSIPARSIADQDLLGRFDKYGQDAIAAFGQENAPLRAFSTIVPPDLEGDMNEALKTFILDGDIEAALGWFVDNYSRFQQ